MLDREKKMSQGCDGLISRFLLAEPQALRMMLQDLQPIPAQSFKFNHLLNAVYVINKNLKININGSLNKMFFKFDDASFKKLNEVFNEYDLIAQKFEISNSFIW